MYIEYIKFKYISRNFKFDKSCSQPRSALARGQIQRLTTAHLFDETNIMLLLETLKDGAIDVGHRWSEHTTLGDVVIQYKLGCHCGWHAHRAGHGCTQRIGILN